MIRGGHASTLWAADFHIYPSVSLAWVPHPANGGLPRNR